MHDIWLAIVALDKAFWWYQTEEYIWRPKNHFLFKETSFWRFWSLIQNVPLTSGFKALCVYTVHAWRATHYWACSHVRTYGHNRTWHQAKFKDALLTLGRLKHILTPPIALRKIIPPRFMSPKFSAPICRTRSLADSFERGHWLRHATALNI